MAKNDQADEEFTSSVLRTLEKSMDVALKFRKKEVQPIHILLVLLCGYELDIDNFDQFSFPEARTPLWSAITDLDVDPLQLAKEIWKNNSIDESAISTPSSLTLNSSNNSHGPHLAPPPNGKSRFAKWPRRRGRSKSPPPSSPRPSRSSPSPSPVPGGGLPPSAALTRVISEARQLRTAHGDSFVNAYHVSLAIASDKEASEAFELVSLTGSSVASALKRARPERSGEDSDDTQFKYLAKYAIDMCALVREKKLNDIIGRDEEIRRVVQVLSRKTKNSAILIGEPGVGKTAVVEGLACRVVSNEVPEGLRGVIFSVDIGSLFAGAGKGEYEERVKGVVADAIRWQESRGPLTLFIDEVHLICMGKGSGQNSGMDAANLLKPVLARGQLRVIGATTLAEYREYIEKDGALTRRFTSVLVSEPTIDEAITILRGTRERYEAHHRVWIMDQAVVAAVNLAHRYLTSKRLPDSAIDLVDEACASAKVAQNMNPEALDSLEKTKSHTQSYIKALTRDDHPEDWDALNLARKRLADLEKETNSLKLQQEQMKEWWDNISITRQRIEETRNALKQSTVPKETDRLRSELEKLRASLLKLEADGPNFKGSATLSGRTLSRISPYTITPESIAAMVEKATKIPIQRLLAEEKTKLLTLEENLAKQVIGQPEAVRTVSDTIRLSRTGLGNADQPVSLLFTGPSGTGKTLLCKTLANELFGQAAAMIRIDGSEYSETHSISRLIGSPPGYVGYDQGGQLTEYVRRTPYCIVLLDEIEKTCLQFLTVFLQVLDEGRLTDGQGEISKATRKRVQQLFVEKGFPLEFLNRIDEIVMFRAMVKNVMVEILNKHLDEIQQREGLKKLRLDVDKDAKNWLIKNGISSQYGGRHLVRVVQKSLLTPLSRALMTGAVHEGDKVIISLDNPNDPSGLVVTKSDR
ncbi:hypothetical protein D9758_007538 [Tetrapyrgos nigripes]|uniref:Clp R domain-containing protein n=1 Tax=Tetrapyrgos nigripes TaxID=182062 RepID=A0A8H5G3H3_9AGAR|nr:hypothetical protein D9758_007538 [Tetrapyrgos nigripes]